MKFGMNLLLWTATVDSGLYPVLHKIKGYGFDGVELPVFDMKLEEYRKVGKQLDELGLLRTAVTVCNEQENPISPDAAIREAGLNRIKKAIDMCAAAGATAASERVCAVDLTVTRVGPLSSRRRRAPKPACSSAP